MTDQPAETDRSAETDQPAADPLDPEDRKLVTLARSSRARVQGLHGAAVRDTTGRTYTAATVHLSSLQVSALRLAVAMAVSSGAPGLEAAALVTADPDQPIAELDLSAVRDLGGTGVPVLVADPTGALRAHIAT